MPESLPAPRLVYGILLAVLLGLVGAVSFRRAATLAYDFHYFYRDAAYVWQHGALNPELPDLAAAMDSDENRWRRQLPFYAPAVPVLLAPLAAFGDAIPAAAIWAGMHVVAVWVSLRILLRWVAGATAARRAALIVAAATAAALPAVLEAARFNQLSFLVLGLLLAGVDRVVHGNRKLTGGALLALATVLKLLPGVFLIWLALKREWRALAAAAVALAVLAAAPGVLVFGPQRTAAYYAEWVEYNTRGLGGGQEPALLREHFTDYRNQAIPAVVARLCRAEHPHAVSVSPLRLSRAGCTWLAAGGAGLLAAGLLWTLRRPLRRLDVHTATGEAAVMAIAMMVFAPLLRQYYLVWALPALVQMCAALPEPTPALRRWALAGMSAWLVGMLAWLLPEARACGAHLIMLIVLGACAVRVGALPRSAATPAREIEGRRR